MKMKIAARVDGAVVKAGEAFWREIVKAFPESMGGDLGPDAARDLELAMMKAANAWVDANVAEPRKGSARW